MIHQVSIQKKINQNVPLDQIFQNISFDRYLCSLKVIEINITDRELAAFIDSNNRSRDPFVETETTKIFSKLQIKNNQNKTVISVTRFVQTNEYLCCVDGSRHQHNSHIRLLFGHQHTNDNEKKIHVFITFMNFIQHNVCKMRQCFRLNQFFQQYARCTIQKARILRHMIAVQTNLQNEILNDITNFTSL